MKQLMKVKGPRDCSLVEVTIHIANLSFQHQQDRKIFEDRKQTFEARQGAYARMCRAIDLLEKWKGVRTDIMRKSGLKEVVC